MKDIVEQAAALLGFDLSGATRLHGGDLSQVMRLRSAEGRTFVVKSGPAVQAEADMLQAIRETGAPAPEVLAVKDELLILEDLGKDDGPGGAWGDLGVVLARLHAVTGTAPGWPRDYAFGAVDIPNSPAADWPSFWAENRLLPSIPYCPADLAGRVERLAARLSDRLPRTPRLSLLHGDLWAGNIMARGGRITGLIDPACYYGHREVDLAMLALFASPTAAFWDRYEPLEPEFEDRRPIYRLWPALVHLRLFGNGYRGLVEGCLDEAG